MDDGMKQLLALQERDLRLVKLRQQIASVPREKERIRAALAEGKVTDETAKQRVLEVEKTINGIEVEIGGLREKKQKLQVQSNDIKKNTEYRAMLEEIAAVDRAIRELEDRELEQMERLEAARAARAAAGHAGKDAEQRAAEEVRDLDRREENCRKEEAEEQARRDEQARLVPPTLLPLYERLRERAAAAGHPARKCVAAIDHDICASCNLKVVPNIRVHVRKGGLATCENCGAILYSE